MAHPRLTVIAFTGAVLLASTGGAVAGSMVTSAHIKDHTIQTRDLAAKTIKALRRMGGYKVVRGAYHLGENEPILTSFTMTCPTGTSVLSADADYTFSPGAGSRTSIVYTSRTARVLIEYYDSAANDVEGTLICGATS